MRAEQWWVYREKLFFFLFNFQNWSIKKIIIGNQNFQSASFHTRRGPSTSMTLFVAGCFVITSYSAFWQRDRKKKHDLARSFNLLHWNCVQVCIFAFAQSNSLHIRWRKKLFVNLCIKKLLKRRLHYVINFIQSYGVSFCVFFIIIYIFISCL